MQSARPVPAIGGRMEFNQPRLVPALQAVIPPVLFGLRMWAAVILALTVAF